MGLLKRRAEEHLDASVRRQRGARAVRMRGGLKASAQACTRDVRTSAMDEETSEMDVRDAGKALTGRIRRPEPGARHRFPGTASAAARCRATPPGLFQQEKIFFEHG